MSDKLNDTVEEPLTTFKEKCKNCFKGPNLIKTIVVAVCFSLVIYQISACVRKLIEKPITTYTHFDFNKTIAYPSITVCREPPYKYDKMLEHGLFAHPRITSTWETYNFSYPLDQLWNEITYNSSEIFAQYGLNELMENVEVKTFIGFLYGRCYTLSPKILHTRATKDSGYSITLQHSAADIASTIGTSPPGYHVYIHYTKEPFTEVPVYNGGLVDYLHCKVGETIDVKLLVNQYVMISNTDDPCINDDGYSANNCATRYVWNRVGEIVGCSGPWMLNSLLPYCSNSTMMRKLIVNYISVCPRFCRSYMYNGFVNDRHTFAWNTATRQWTARIGDATMQTQGFLLGLSVIGIMSIMGKFWSTFIKPGSKSSNNTNTDLKTALDEKTFHNNEDACKEKDVKSIFKLNYR
ncbi:unnamed protein product [Diatraea saccharalis]|uniref:Uncharacterized protein n=1 Tax=Diatraea saccharalis TaxID=40085 RepID=A0A9N9W9S8_9NEOP|nr:unnamed protein product [Diatraea saccharalis]